MDLIKPKEPSEFMKMMGELYPAIGIGLPIVEYLRR